MGNIRKILQTELARLLRHALVPGVIWFFDMFGAEGSAAIIESVALIGSYVIVVAWSKLQEYLTRRGEAAAEAPPAGEKAS